MKKYSILLLTLGMFFNYCQITFGQYSYQHTPVFESLITTWNKYDLEAFKNPLSGTGLDGGNLASCAWLSTGNDNISPDDRLGTINNEPLRIITNNAETLRLNTTGRMVFYNSDSHLTASYSNLYIAGGNDNPIIGHTGISSNTVVGIGSFRDNIGGQFNSVFGNSLLYKNTSGNSNTVVGYNSLILSTTGSQNIVLGSNALNVNTSGSFNIAIGNGTLARNTTGQYNIHLGQYDASTGVTTGTRNIGIGYNAGKNITTGSNNIIIGSENAASFPGTIMNAPVGVDKNNQLNIGNWIYGYNGQIAIGDFAPVNNSISHVFTNNEDFKLIVRDGIKTEKVRVELANVNDWSDHVFSNGYDLMSLEELEDFITKNRHLPNIPTAEEVFRDGIDLGEMDAKLLEKIEELALYNIDLNKENLNLKKESKLQQKQIEEQQFILKELLKRVEQLESTK